MCNLLLTGMTFIRYCLELQKIVAYSVINVVINDSTYTQNIYNTFSKCRKTVVIMKIVVLRWHKKHLRENQTMTMCFIAAFANFIVCIYVCSKIAINVKSKQNENV